MRNDSFDNLARAAADPGVSSRRKLLRMLFAGTIGTAATQLVPAKALAEVASGRGENVVRGPTGATLTCQSGNNFSGSCFDFLQYATECGVICQSGNRAPTYGCTSGKFDIGSSSQTTILVRHDSANKRWCASTLLTLKIVADFQITTLEWTSTEPACCASECVAKYDQFRQEVITHEEAHVSDAELVAGNVSASYFQKRVVGCAAKKTDSVPALQAEVEAQKVNAKAEAADLYSNLPDPPVNFVNFCDVCRAAIECDFCQDGACVTGPACGDLCCPPDTNCLPNAETHSPECCPVPRSNFDLHLCCPPNRIACRSSCCGDVGWFCWGGYCCPPDYQACTDPFGNQYCATAC
jgi:hypothetical protein